MSFQNVLKYRIARRLVDATEAELRKAGRSGYELFVLWSGRIAGDTFEAQTMHVPQQRSYKLESGLCVRVEGSALHGLNQWLYEHGELLGVQIHTHPTEAYHSDTDDAYPIVTALGGVSIVVPNFCRSGLLSAGTVAYRLRAGGWAQVPDATLRRILEVV